MKVLSYCYYLQRVLAQHEGRSPFLDLRGRHTFASGFVPILMHFYLELIKLLNKHTSDVTRVICKFTFKKLAPGILHYVAKFEAPEDDAFIIMWMVDHCSQGTSSRVFEHGGARTVIVCQKALNSNSASAFLS